MTNEVRLTLAYFVRNKKKYFPFIIQITFCLLIINILFFIRNNYYVIQINILKNDENNKTVIVSANDLDVIKENKKINAISPIIEANNLTFVNDGVELSDFEIKTVNDEKDNYSFENKKFKYDEVLVSKSLFKQIGSNYLNLKTGKISYKLQIVDYVEDGGRYIIFTPEFLQLLIDKKLVSNHEYKVILKNYDDIEEFINNSRQRGIFIRKSENIQENEITNLEQMLTIFDYFVAVISSIIIICIFLIFKNVFLSELDIITLYNNLGFSKKNIFKILILIYKFIMIISILFIVIISILMIFVFHLLLGNILYIFLIQIILIKFYLILFLNYKIKNLMMIKK